MTDAGTGFGSGTRVGFVGLGKIGLPICRNLLASGAAVVGYRRGAMDAFVAAGGIPARSPADLAAQVGIVFTCVDSDAAMETVVAGPGGLLETVRPGQVVVCLSSHPVAVKQGFADALAARGAVMLDGEVSGTPGMVEARKAAVYLAGDRQAAEQSTPVILGFTDICLYLGAFGGASRVKLVNNFLVAHHIAGAAQAVAIAQAWGLDPDLMIPAVAQGSGASTQFAIRAPWMAARRFMPQQGAADVLHHYLELVRDAAAGLDVSTELVDSLIAFYGRAAPVVGQRDVAAVFELFERRQPSQTDGDMP